MIHSTRRNASAVCMLWRGVRLSSVQLHPSRVDIVSKRLLALSRKQRRMVAGRLKFSDANDILMNMQQGRTQVERRIHMGWEKFAIIEKQLVMSRKQ